MSRPPPAPVPRAASTGARLADAFHDADEAYRSARTRDLLSRGWPAAAAVAAALVLGVLGFLAWSAYSGAQGARASKAYADAVAAAQAGRSDEARRDFESIGAGAPPAYRALALMQEAGLDLKANKAPMALNRLDQATHATPDRILSDAAALEAAYVAMDTKPLSNVENRLAPLMETRRPYRDMAREALATAKLAAGRPREARGDFQLLVLSQDASDQARQRAQAALAMIDSGAAAAVPAVVKAELALPPLPPAAAGAAIPGAQ